MAVGAESIRRVLLVEDRADHVHGHYAPLARSFASGLASLGCEVTLLTSLGWQPGDDPDPSSWSIARYGPLGRGIERGLRQVDVQGLPGGWRRILGPPTVRARSVLAILETRRAARRLGSPTEVGVVVLSLGISPKHVGLLAPAAGTWVCFRHSVAGRKEVAQDRAHRTVRRGVRRALAWRARVRAQHGGRLVLVGGYGDLVRSWQARLPGIATGVVSLPIMTRADPVDGGSARRELGLPSQGRIALFFGACHRGKSPETVWRAWCCDPPGVLLVAAGHGVRASLDEWLGRHPGADPSAIHVIDGPIDDRTKQLLFSASDVGVCSFPPEPVGASATLLDFAAYGRPICCSSGGDPADMTRRYGLGRVFEAGDDRALARAVSEAELHPDDAGLRALEADHSEVRTAHDLLEWLNPANLDRPASRVYG